METRDIEITGVGCVTAAEFDTRSLEDARQHALETGGTLYTYCGSDEHYYWRGVHFVNRLSYVVVPDDLGETFVASDSSEFGFTLGRLEGEIHALKQTHGCAIAALALHYLLEFDADSSNSYSESELEEALTDYNHYANQGKSPRLFLELYKDGTALLAHEMKFEAVILAENNESDEAA